jgi:UDP:flavonoid glycosyltransferase YjiC (YdhE family)
MKAVLSSRGSRGDVNPIIEIGGLLNKKGHEVSICIPAVFKGYALAQKLVPSVYDEDSKELMKGLGSGLKSVKKAIDFFKNSIDQQFDFLLDATEHADVLIATVNELTAPTVAEYRNIPHFRLTFAPVLPGNHPPPFSPWQNMPVIFNKMGWGILSLLSITAIRKFINKKRTELRLKPVTDSNYYHTGNSHTLLSINRDLAPPCKTWEGRYTYDYTGYCYGQIDGKLNDEVLKFIDEGEPPVYVGFGSVHIKNAGKFSQMVVEAASVTGCRVILGQGWMDLGNGYLKDNIFCISDAHHATLFPKMAGIVHHGGSGTTHTAAKAGIPQLILPQTVDQYFWGNRIRQMGLGPGSILPRKIKTRDLVSTFRSFMTGKYTKKVIAQSVKMKKEDGVQRSVEIILDKIEHH